MHQTWCSSETNPFIVDVHGHGNTNESTHGRFWEILQSRQRKAEQIVQLHGQDIVIVMAN